MNSNLLAYVFPLYDAFGASERLTSWVSPSYEDAPGSRHAPLIQQIAERIFTAEHQPGAPYYHRVEEMIKSLPARREEKIQNFVEMRILTRIDNEHLITSEESPPSYCIFLPESFPSCASEEEFTEALPWLVSREISYFLGKEEQYAYRWATVASLVVAFVTTSFLGWGLLASFAATYLSNFFSYATYRTLAERRADAFANKHCTVEERKKALTIFEKMIRPHFAEKTDFHHRELDYPVRMKSLRASLQPA